MKCMHCRGEMKPAALPSISIAKAVVTLDHVSAWVCEPCGESYFEEKVVTAILELVEALEEKAEALTAV